MLRDLFGSPVFASWLEGEHTLHIFLDSLDECLLRVNTVAALLIDELAEYSQREGLYLRIACRTADWPISLERELRGLWGDESVGVYELAPLTQDDVAIAAEANGISAHHFLDEVDRVNAAPFAMKPITLKFLLNAYLRNKRLPGTQIELYEAGCRLLCEETNEDRRGAKLIGAFTAEQRMMMAARIAAITVYCNRNTVWIEPDYGEMPEEDMGISDLCGWSEESDSGEFHVSESAIRETLATGLFSSRGPKRMGWAHQTYAEFLAAWYLVKTGATLPQILSLVLNSGDFGRRVIPQLHETAAWLATMIPELFWEIMPANPDVLLLSDVASACVEAREVLVDNLLRFFDEERLHDRAGNLRGSYRKLKHPGLAEQLRPYIRSGDKGGISRRAAIDLAEACRLQSLQEDLLEVVLNISERHKTRAICQIADEVTKEKLKPLLSELAGDDFNDDLRGCALQALWPQHISIEELLSALTYPKWDDYIGFYKLFLRYDVVERMDTQDLVAALHWTENLGVYHRLPFAFQEVLEYIFWKGWLHLECPGVLDAFARAMLIRLTTHDDFVRNSRTYPILEGLRGHDRYRRLVLQTMVPILAASRMDPRPFVFTPTTILMSHDFDWFIEQIQSAESEAEAEIWALFIRRVFDAQNTAHVEVAYDVCQVIPVLGKEFDWLFGSVGLDSPEARRLKAIYEQDEKWRQEREQRAAISSRPSIEEQTLFHLNRFEAGDLNAWWQLLANTFLDSDGPDSEFNPQITTLNGWQTLSRPMRDRLIEAAKRYISEYTLETVNWIGTNTFSRPALAGYKALILLFQKDEGCICNLPVAIWEKWLPAIVVTPLMNGGDGIRSSLVRIAYLIEPEAVIEIMMQLIDHDNEEHGNIFVLGRFEACWDDRFSESIMTKIRDPLLKPSAFLCLLRALFDHNASSARALAESFVRLPLPESEEARLRSIAAAEVLMTHANDVGWSVIWPVVQEAPEFGHGLFQAIASDPEERLLGVVQKMAETQIADLYIWLCKQFPHSTDPRETGAHHISQRESIADWRDALLTHLQNRGTVEACSAVRRISESLPDLDWMKWVLLEAQNATCRNQWVPPQPSVFLQMIRNKRARLVNSGTELLDVIFDSLKCLENKLHGETPAARYIWDCGEPGICRPIPEEPFSDYVKRHLEEDVNRRGIVVNREVQIRRREGKVPGQETDILVDAVIPKMGDSGGYDVVTVIIEVKGCWNSELKTAMETQLVGRYMKDNFCNHGLYLVGWFYCEQWDDEDHRKQKTPKLTLVEAQGEFDAQARYLSKDGTVVKAYVMNTALR